MFIFKCFRLNSLLTRAETNTPSDEYDSYLEYRVVNICIREYTFFSEANFINLIKVYTANFVCRYSVCRRRPHELAGRSHDRHVTYKCKSHAKRTAAQTETSL